MPKESESSRMRMISGGEGGEGPVIYWMSRDQRAGDNWAVIHSQRIAIEKRRPLLVVFCLLDDFLGAQKRHFEFMLRGLEVVRDELGRRDIGFELLRGKPAEEIPKIVSEHGASALVTDFSPVRARSVWNGEIAGSVEVPFYEVDAHNIVPCWVASDKVEYGAYTIRPKIHRLLGEYLVRIPRVKKHPCAWDGGDEWSYEPTGGKDIPGWLNPGERSALRSARAFVKRGLGRYPEDRNDPSRDGQSNLSPYLHFGQLSAQRLALDVGGSDAPEPSKEAFIEELVVRRELSDNFCYYNDNYDSTRGFPEWARRTLDEHREDKREYTYSREEFEEGRTHDTLWNAAQLEMVDGGKMHGYMRMYWAKKLLEWSETPEMALETGIYLNDRYEMDGRDPNGYAGMAWSIGGVHDRAWGERPVFGKIRYMNRRGCERKFDVQAYIDKVESTSSRVVRA